jgi:hypothetical protein
MSWYGRQVVCKLKSIKTFFYSVSSQRVKANEKEEEAVSRQGFENSRFR